MRNDTQLDLTAELAIAAARIPAKPVILAAMREQWTTQIFQQQPARVSPASAYTFKCEVDMSLFGEQWELEMALLDICMQGLLVRCSLDVRVHQIKAELRRSIQHAFVDLRAELEDTLGLVL